VRNPISILSFSFVVLSFLGANVFGEIRKVTQEELTTIQGSQIVPCYEGGAGIDSVVERRDGKCRVIQVATGPFNCNPCDKVWCWDTAWWYVKNEVCENSSPINCHGTKVSNNFYRFYRVCNITSIPCNPTAYSGWKCQPNAIMGEMIPALKCFW
jgi:hypothetical protein